MIFNDTGKIIDDLYMVGHPAMPMYLLDGQNPAIFDAGLAFLGRIYVNGLHQILNQRNPVYCFLSHSHFDHCGSVAVLKKYFPGMKVVASERAKQVLGRPNALALMRKLTEFAEQLIQRVEIKLDEIDQFEPFEVDLTAKEGDVIELSKDVAIHVLETPGHTQDSLSYFIPGKKILLCSEAAGLPDATGYIVTEALVDYDLYVESMRRLSKLDFEVLCLGHRQALTGQDAKNYFQKSMADCRHFLNLVERSLEAFGGDVQKTIMRVKAVEYDPIKGPKQIEPAYLLNLEAKIKAIKRRLENKSDSLKLAN
jgi:glyoxylase-like metal-dependent hydrolase (beta-lactamase superfamily II)